jgi:membrane protein
MSATTDATHPRDDEHPLKRKRENIIQELRRLPKRKLAKETLSDLKGDDVPGLAAEIAYHFIFAIPPMIIFLVMLAAVMNRFTGVPVAERLRDVIDQSAPGDTKALLNNLVDNAVAQVSGGLASFGVLLAALLALWSGSNGVASLIKAFNRAYDVEETRSWFKKKGIAVGLTALLGLLINAAFVLFVFGGQIGDWIARKVGLSSAFTTAWNLGRWPLGLLFVVALLALLYYLGPNVEQTFRWLSTGSVVATVLWLLIALGFKLYLTVTNPGSAYGALGSVVVLLYFLFLTGIAFVVGAEVNALIGRRYDPETVKDLAEHPQKAESAQAQHEAEGHARDMDDRDGSNVATRAKHRAFEPGRKAAEHDPEKQPSSASSARPPGRAATLLGSAGGFAVALALTLARRKKQQG